MLQIICQEGQDIKQTEPIMMSEVGIYTTVIVWKASFSADSKKLLVISAREFEVQVEVKRMNGWINDIVNEKPVEPETQADI